MTQGQWRVLALLLLLAFMESLKYPAVKAFFTSLAFNPFKQAAS